jgi:hypothetical protein
MQDIRFFSPYETNQPEEKVEQIPTPSSLQIHDLDAHRSCFFFQGSACIKYGNLNGESFLLKSRR